MASAAAVATDIARSPLPDHEVNEELGTVATVIGATDDVPNGAIDDDDEDDVAVKPKRKGVASKANGVDGDGDVEMGEDQDEEAAMDKDLFGSDDGEPA